MNGLIFRCIKPGVISQRFHDNLACVRPDLTVIRGSYPNACPSGTEKLYEKLGMKSHGGIDRPCAHKEPIFFDALDFDTKWDMYVEIDNAGGLGIDVATRSAVLKCREPSCEEYHHFKRRMWHGESAMVWIAGAVRRLDVPSVYALVAGKERAKVQEDVRPGYLLGYGDSTGLSSGNHIHDASKWCDANADGIHADNGYYGSFDDSFMRVDKFIHDELEERAKEAEGDGDQVNANDLRSQISSDQLNILTKILQLMQNVVLLLQQQLRDKIGGLF